MRRAAALAIALGLAVTAGAGAAAPPGAVLGGEGELFVIEQGLFGELMNRPRSPLAENSALVLRVKRPDQPDALHPLPATLGPEVESAAALLYEESSGTLFVAWETRTNLIHSQILLAGFAGGEWGEPIDVSDRRFSFKSDPRLAVTRDAFEGRDADGEPVTVRRTVLHVVWVEDRAEGTAVVYSPVVLVDGVFEGTGPGPIYALTELVTPAEEDVLPAPLTDLPLPPTVEAGSDSHSVVVGFVHPASGRLVTLDLSVLSGDVSALADRGRAHWIEVGSRYDTGDPGSLASLADESRAHFIEVGGRLDPEVLSFVSDRMREFILEVGPEYRLDDPDELSSFSDRGRAHLIEVGNRLEQRGLRRQTAPARVLDLPAAAGAPSHQIGLRVAAARRLEGLDAGAAPLVLLSADGADALVAWEQDGQLRYQESRGEGWSDTRAIALGTVGLERALEIVEHRVRNR
jgi:hypothetical protein